MFKAIKRLVEIKKKHDEQLKTEGKDAVKEALAEFFAAFPDLSGIRWRQYPPYFNDGDACVFSLQGIEVQFKGAKRDPEAEEGDREDGTWLSEWDLKGHADIKATLEKFENSLNGILPALESAFGEHAEVTATRKEITVEEYTDHD